MAIAEFAPRHSRMNHETTTPAAPSPAKAWAKAVPPPRADRQPEVIDSGAKMLAMFDPRRPDEEAERREVLNAIEEALRQFGLADDFNIGRQFRSLAAELSANAISTDQARMELDGHVASLKQQGRTADVSATDAFRNPAAPAQPSQPPVTMPTVPSFFTPPSLWGRTLLPGPEVPVAAMTGGTATEPDVGSSAMPSSWSVPKTSPARDATAPLDGPIGALTAAPPPLLASAPETQAGRGEEPLRPWSAEWWEYVQQVQQLASGARSPDTIREAGALYDRVYSGQVSAAAADAAIDQLQQSTDRDALLAAVAQLEATPNLTPETRQALAALHWNLSMGGMQTAQARAELERLRQAQRLTLEEAVALARGDGGGLPSWFRPSRSLWQWELPPAAEHSSTPLMTVIDPSWLDDPEERNIELALQTGGAYLADFIGAPVDWVTLALNALIRGLNGTFDTNIPMLVDPIGSSGWMRHGAASIAERMGVTVRDPETEMTDWERTLYTQLPYLGGLLTSRLPPLPPPGTDIFGP